MADETQTTPVAGVQENATQNAEVDTSVKAQEESLKKNFPTLIGYLYMSDPDNANPLWHHYVMPVFDEKAYENLPWHVYKERPSDDLVDPLYSVKSGGWVENAHDAQAQILAQVQENQSNGTAQTLALTKSIKALSEGQANQNKLLASMQNLMLQMANQKQTTPAQPSTTETTDTKQENGGN